MTAPDHARGEGFRSYDRLLSALFGIDRSLFGGWYRVVGDKFRQPLEVAPELLGEPGLRFLGDLTTSAPYELRLAAVMTLRDIAAGRNHAHRFRAQAAALLADVLRRDSEVLIRLDAVRPFEASEVAALSATGRETAAWWMGQRQAAHQATVLISESESVLGYLMERVLTTCGWRTVFRCEEPEETLEPAGKLQPALVITDLAKPRMWGDEMAQALKSSPRTRHIPLLLVTAQASDRIARAMATGHFKAALAKPFLLRELTGTVEMVCAGTMPSD